jgi:hypothetical protein
VDSTHAQRTPYDEVAPAPRRSWRDRLGPDWLTALRYCLVVYLCVRLGLFALGLLTVSLVPMQPPVGVPGWPALPQTAGWHNAVTAWERADALWFLRIASDGYRLEDSSAAFFPLFPLLVRAVAWVTGGRYLLAGFVVSNVALIAGLTVLFKLTREEFGELFARRTVLYLCLFPTAFFLFAPFSEPLFLALAVGALYAARHRSWPAAGLLGAGAAATRSIGILLCAVLAVEALHQLLADRGSGRPWPVRRTAAVLGSCAVPALGTGLYLLYWQRRAGDWTIPFHAQGSWERHLASPWHTLWRGLRTGTADIGGYPGGYWTLDLLLVGVALALAVWVARRTRPVYAAYAWLSLVFPLLFVFDGRPLMSDPRFLLPVFPLFWGLARFSERWRAHDLMVAVSAAGLALVGALAVSWLPIF